MFDWQHYYLLARELLTQADSTSYKEALLRSVTSRAYYAAYHRACDYLEAIGGYPNDQALRETTRGSHNLVIDIFFTATERPEWKKIGKKLKKLKAIRQQADYDKSGERWFMNIEKTKKRIDQAEEIIQLIDSLPLI
jgi:uncharacterized protein (UPF0332 family)